jgi:hypothetical protein
MPDDYLEPRESFLAACRKVLSSDKPAVVLRAMQEGDPRMNEVHALDVRSNHPELWFCSGIDHQGIPRLYAFGESEQKS